MASSLEVVTAGPADRLPLYRMLELYQHDLSDIWDQELDIHGEYGYELDRFMSQSEAWAYVFRSSGNLAGFALVDTQVRITGDDFWMDQFFVLKKYRRQGIGAEGALKVFARHPGRWQVGEMPENVAAQAFWRKLIGAYTAGKYTEERLTSGWWQGYVQRFISPGQT
jgi:predicted acetyltransferase